ncbi:MAG TPA: cbb3-type cytochrome oxidase assembly protein CcoS [Marinobacter sp.]|jgi:cbb3-type cytochrome oxidase maturation protein|uniref:cbb3-type cytochrome oxidase assembly protein CcoS n=1 Tax=Marinobacter sp. TaxID=50741 RepID=UPI000EE90108|nr:cbb3-type cytochrome oxidase assembly protein CcoS [Marinobacter sp.]MBC7193324.1 cbb3-type cytochrome oxidase assembly protein CcoS [Marinobacter sp.]HCW89879.1 cbb3-type cytochrome oxidase assembly protein CcoS [Marinobacter sp.]
MKIVMVLVPLMLILVAIGIALFSWAVRNGQYDDLDGPAHRILYDDDEDRIPAEARQKKPARPSSADNSENNDTTDHPDRNQ